MSLRWSSHRQHSNISPSHILSLLMSSNQYMLLRDRGNRRLATVYIRNDAGTSLVVQWLRLHASTAGGRGFIPGQKAKILSAMWHGQKQKTTKTEMMLYGAVEEPQALECHLDVHSYGFVNNCRSLYMLVSLSETQFTPLCPVS